MGDTHDLISLTVVILAQNESENIERCLQSVAWAGEIVILDCSDDDTLKIAKACISSDRLKVVASTETDFSVLRNKGNALAKYDWVLHVDADEEVGKDLRKEMTQKLRDTQSHGFYVRRDDYFLGTWLKHGETAQVRLLKLGRKKAGVWKRPVHETWHIQGKVENLTSPLFHYPHPTIAEFVGRINRWTTIDAQYFYTSGQRSSFVKVIAYPAAKFVLNYFLRLGLLDGTPGLFMAVMMSFHSFLTRGKLYLLQNSE